MVMDPVAPGHIRVDGKDVALGLLWQKRARGMTIRQQAAAAAGQANIHDLYAPVAGREQICLTSSSGSHAARMLVGALQIQTETLGTNWLAAFPLAGTPGPIWVVAMREGDVYEDSVHETVAAAHQTYLQLANAPDWETRIAPLSWKIEDADDVALAEVFHPRPLVRLQPINRVAAFAPWLMGAAMIGILSAVLWTHLPDALDRVMQGPAPVPEVMTLPVQPPPWLEKPLLMAFATHCIRLVGGVYIPHLGWEMAPITCGWQGRTVRVVAQWKRTGGSYGRLRDVIETRLETPLQLGCAGACATLTVTEEMAGADLHADAGNWAAATTETRLRERFHDLGLSMKMTLRQLPRPAGHDAQPVAVTESYHDVSLDVASGLDDHLALLGDVPALVPEAMTFMPTTDRWLVTARIHHREPAV